MTDNEAAPQWHPDLILNWDTRRAVGPDGTIVLADDALLEALCGSEDIWRAERASRAGARAYANELGELGAIPGAAISALALRQLAPENLPALLTKEETAIYLSKDERTISRMISDGLLSAVRSSMRGSSGVLVTRESIVAHIAASSI